MTDIHAHVLPGMDDGSGSTEESLAMLRASAEQGISRVAATPHFYAWENSPAEFLARRAAAAERLRARWAPELPTLLLGAEVCYFEGMSRVRELDALRVEGTRLLLLEMPFAPWTDRMLRELLLLHQRLGVDVLLAHMERYLRFQKRAVWTVLREAGVLMQCNAGFFLDWRTRARARRMLRSGQVHLLGSDCHNMRTRPPRLGDALQLLGERELAVLTRQLDRLVPE